MDALDAAPPLDADLEHLTRIVAIYQGHPARLACDAARLLPAGQREIATMRLRKVVAQFDVISR